VATDCLSEGINLQRAFDAVVHYDLAWNPTRHEQREGRVDRFGQTSKQVRCTLIYGQNNPVDGFVLEVILRKAKVIQEELGVMVPLPEDDKRVRLALVKSALMRSSRNSPTQGSLNFEDADEDLQAIESSWRDAREKAKANRTIFRQGRLKPQEVLPEWHKQMSALGEPEDVQRFVSLALTRLGVPLEPTQAKAFKVLPQHLPLVLKERMAVEGREKPFAVSFHYPPVPGTEFVHRSHPMVSLLADHWLEGALSGSLSLTARSGAFETSAVSKVTTIYLVRLRHQLDIVQGNTRRSLMAEESLAWAVQGRSSEAVLPQNEVEKLLDAHPSGNLATEVQTREIEASLAWFRGHQKAFEDLARSQSQTLLADHRRVRDASGARGQYTVEPCLPVDLIGVYVLLPDTL
jgi:hypothetical protein